MIRYTANIIIMRERARYIIKSWRNRGIDLFILLPIDVVEYAEMPSYAVEYIWYYLYLINLVQYLYFFILFFYYFVAAPLGTPPARTRPSPFSVRWQVT